MEKYEEEVIETRIGWHPPYRSNIITGEIIVQYDPYFYPDLALQAGINQSELELRKTEIKYLSKLFLK